MANALAAFKAARTAEERRRMTHWTPQDHHQPVLSLADLGELGAEALTPYGNYVSARDAVEDFQRGHPGSGSHSIRERFATSTRSSTQSSRASRGSSRH